MNDHKEKPSAEAEALSLFLMAYKAANPSYKEKSKRINKQWDLVREDKLSRSDYMEEVQSMLSSFGGYSKVVEKTVKHYIDTTGEWKLRGDDTYCIDAKKVAEILLKKK